MLTTTKPYSSVKLQRQQSNLLPVLLFFFTCCGVALSAAASPPPSVVLVSKATLSNTSLVSNVRSRANYGPTLTSLRVKLEAVGSTSERYKYFTMSFTPPLGDVDHPANAAVSMATLLEPTITPSATPQYAEIRTVSETEFGSVGSAASQPISGVSFSVQWPSPRNIEGLVLPSVSYRNAGWLTARVGAQNLVGGGVCNVTRSTAERTALAVSICTSMGLPSVPATLIPNFGRHPNLAITVSNVAPTTCTVSSYTDKLNDCTEADVYGIMCGNESLPAGTVPVMALCAQVTTGSWSTSNAVSSPLSEASVDQSTASRPTRHERRGVAAQEAVGVTSAEIVESCGTYDGLCRSCIRLLTACGYCASTGRCIAGNESGPSAGSCPSWTWSSWNCPSIAAGESCAALSYDGCSTCTSFSTQCAYCVSSGLCVNTSTSSCDGLAFNRSSECSNAACRRYDGQCAACTVSGCGYCTATSQCVSGYSTRPYYTQDCPNPNTGAVWWQYGTSSCVHTAAYCASYQTSCSNCVYYGCTFCSTAASTSSVCTNQGTSGCGGASPLSSNTSTQCVDLNCFKYDGDCSECTSAGCRYCVSSGKCTYYAASNTCTQALLRSVSNCPVQDRCRDYSGSACRSCVQAFSGGVCTFCSVTNACRNTSLTSTSYALQICPMANRSASLATCPSPTQSQCSGRSCYNCLSYGCTYCSTTGACNSPLSAATEACDGSARYTSRCPAAYCNSYSYDCGTCVAYGCTYCVTNSKGAVCTDTSTNAECSNSISTAATSSQCAAVDTCRQYDGNCEDCPSNCDYCQSTGQCLKSTLGVTCASWALSSSQCAVRDGCRGYSYSGCWPCLRAFGGGVCSYCASSISCRNTSMTSIAMRQCATSSTATLTCPVPSGESCAAYNYDYYYSYGCTSCTDYGCTYCGTVCTNNTANCPPASTVVSDSRQCAAVMCRQYDGMCAECTSQYNCGYCNSTGLCFTGNSSGPASGTCASWSMSYTICARTAEFCAFYYTSSCSTCVSRGCTYCASSAGGSNCTSPTTASSVCAERPTASSSSQCRVVTCPLYNGQCELCQSQSGCGYCVSSATCMPGSSSGPTSGSCGAASWLMSSGSSCPRTSTYCQYFGSSSCSNCAAYDCAYCLVGRVASCNVTIDACAGGQGTTNATQCTTAIDACRQYDGDCYECGQYYYINCGYCEATGLCVRGTSSGPLSGTCPSSWRFYYWNCPEYYNGCRNYYNCHTCTTAFGGNVCTFCEETSTCTNASSPVTQRCAVAQRRTNKSFCPNVTQSTCSSQYGCESCVSIDCIYCATSQSCNSPKYAFLCGAIPENTASTSAQCMAMECLQYHGSCNTCVQQSGCGYCGSTARCVSGRGGGPTSGQCSGSTWYWGSVAACPRSASFCSGYASSCASCVGNGCSFCYLSSGRVCSNTSSACGSAPVAVAPIGVPLSTAALCTAVIKATGVYRIRRAVSEQLGLPEYRVKAVDSNDTYGTAANLAAASSSSAACFYIDHGYPFKDSTATVAYSPADVMYQLLATNAEFWRPYGVSPPVNASRYQTQFAHFRPPPRVVVNATLLSLSFPTDSGMTAQELMRVVVARLLLDPQDVVILTETSSALSTSVTFRFMFRNAAVSAYEAALNGTLVPFASVTPASEPQPEPPATLPPSSDTSDAGSSVAALVGGIIGGLVAVALFGGAAYWYIKVRPASRSASGTKSLTQEANSSLGKPMLDASYVSQAPSLATSVASPPPTQPPHAAVVQVVDDIELEPCLEGPAAQLQEEDIEL